MPYNSLAGVLPELQQAFDALNAGLASSGVTLGVADYGGLRDEQVTADILGFRQADYNAEHGLPSDTVTDVATLNHFRPIAQYGHSYHDYGAAFDFTPIARPAGMSVAQVEQLAGQLAPSVGLTWGGTFPNYDGDHMQLAISLDDARQRYSAMTGTVPGTGGDISAMLPASSDDESGSGDAYAELAADQSNTFAMVVGVTLVALAAVWFIGHHRQ